MTEDDSQLQRILETLAAGGAPTTAEMLDYGRTPRAIARLAGATSGLDAETRRRRVRLIADLGRPMIPATGPAPERPGPIVTNADAVAFLVTALGDADRSVRGTAAEVLTTLVPRAMVAEHAAQIIAALRAEPATDNAARLLGRTRSDEALSWLRSEPSFASTSPEDTQVALAALGDAAAEETILSALPGETEPGERIALLHKIGAIGSDGAMRALAAEIRSAEIYVAPDGARVSMRVPVIEALHAARLEEEVFAPPWMPPQDDAYYERIEAWLVEHLSTSWAEPRPAFFYRSAAPMPPSPPPPPTPAG